ESGLEDGFDIEAGGESYPEEKAALGMGPSYGGREEIFEGLEHDVAAFAINLADQFHMFVEIAVAGHFIGHELVEGRSMQVGALLELGELADNFGRSDDP